jgi:hypothetical protein
MLTASSAFRRVRYFGSRVVIVGTVSVAGVKVIQDAILH